MKRKNKRHETKDTPDKSPEKPSRRSNRHSKRKRRSSSSSPSPEREKISHAKRKDTPVKESSPRGNDKVEEVDKAKEKEATVWKVQSANGAGGEIQKLKICRTRMLESQDESPKQEGSPKRRSTRLKDSNQKSTTDECSSGTEDQLNADGEKIAKQKHKTRTSSRNSPALTDSPNVKCDVSVSSPTKIKIHIENKSSEKVILSPEKPDKDICDETARAVASINCDDGIKEDEKIVDNQIEQVEEPVEKEAAEFIVNLEDIEPPKDVEEVKVKEDEHLPIENEPPKVAEVQDESANTETTTEIVEIPIEESVEIEETPQVETSEVVEDVKEDKEEPLPLPVNKKRLRRPSSSHSASPRVEKEASSSSSEEASSDDSGSESSGSECDGQEAKKKKRRKGGIKSTVTRQEPAKKKSPSPAEIPRPDEVSGKQEPEEELEEGEARDEDETEVKPGILVNDKENAAASLPSSGPTERIPRKRRWGASKTIRPPKKPVLCISTDSLKNLIPEAKPVSIEEVRLSVDDETERDIEVDEREKSVENSEQVNEVKKKEKKEQKRERHKDRDKEKEEKKSKDKKELSKSPEPEKPSVTDKVNRRICVLSEDARKLVRSPSPARRRPSNVLFITNLVRPFTVPQLRNLLARTGQIADNGFWIDKIKSKCYVQYLDEEAAIETRHALHGVRWPVSNPRTLCVEFASYDDMAVAQAISEETETIPRKAEPLQVDHSVEGWLAEQARVNAERNQRRVVREWDVGKPAHPDEELELRPMRPYEDVRDRERRDRDRDRDRRKKDRLRSRSSEASITGRKVRRKDDAPAAKRLDDLFRKTKTSPCVYWLPLTAEQIVIKAEMRRKHMAEHERRIAEIKKAEQARRDRDRDRRRK